MKITIKFDFDANSETPYCAWAYDVNGKSLGVGMSATSFELAEKRVREKASRLEGIVVPEPKEVEI